MQCLRYFSRLDPETAEVQGASGAGEVPDDTHAFQECSREN